MLSQELSGVLVCLYRVGKCRLASVLVKGPTLFT
jgi:hypothetical protein